MERLDFYIELATSVQNSFASYLVLLVRHSNVHFVLLNYLFYDHSCQSCFRLVLSVYFDRMCFVC